MQCINHIPAGSGTAFAMPVVVNPQTFISSISNFNLIDTCVVGTISLGTSPKCTNVGLEEYVSSNATIQILYHPISDKLTIRSSSEKISQITITALSGQIILKKDFQNNFNSPIEIDLTNQSKGIYLIQIITANEVYNQKIVLN